MNAVNHFVPTWRRTRQGGFPWWLVSSLALVLTLLVGCMPIQPPATFVGLSTGLDNAKQARIRMVDSVMGAPNIDLYINGLPVVNGGKPLQNIGVGITTGWIYVTPGTYTVAFVAHSMPLAQALFTPVAINAVAGHRLTVAMMGQMKEKNLKPLVVDETVLEARIGAKPTDCVSLEINNVKGADRIDDFMDGEPYVEDIKYGDAMAGICNKDNVHDKAIMNGKPEAVIFESDIWNQPATGFLTPYYGEYPGTNSSGGSQGTSDLNTLDFLAGFNSRHVLDHGHLITFKTLLTVIDKAGMLDMFVNHDPYYFLAPTDEAFAALPKAQLDALLNDPKALTTLLKTHFVAGYYPYGNLSGPTYGTFGNVTVTNLLRQKLAMSEPSENMSINGLAVLGSNYSVGNGNRIQTIDKLLPVK